MNVHDSEQMIGLLGGEGYHLAASAEEADLVIINTCSIRDKAYHKMKSELGALDLLKQSRPELKVGAAGCAAQQEGRALLKRFPRLDFVMGPDAVPDINRIIQDVRRGGRPVATDIHVDEDYEFASVVFPATQGRATAYVTIMKGCDNVCSFCIVPKLRGPEVYRPFSEIIKEIRTLVAGGVREVTLLGQNVNSYGRGSVSAVDFAGLIRKILDETTVERIRYTSPHPKDLSDEVIAIYGETQRLSPHIHLPVQSGSDRILAAMRRSYRQRHYLKKIEALKKACPTIAITSDFIVGFPGETEADFAQTLDLVAAVGFDNGFSFAYSPRPGTEAATLPDAVPEDIQRERLDRLQEQLNIWSWRRNRALIGSQQKVLIESVTGPKAYGRTEGNKAVDFPGNGISVGDIVDIKVRGASPHALTGVLE